MMFVQRRSVFMHLELSIHASANIRIARKVDCGIVALSRPPTAPPELVGGLAAQLRPPAKESYIRGNGKASCDSSVISISFLALRRRPGS